MDVQRLELKLSMKADSGLMAPKRWLTMEAGFAVKSLGTTAIARNLRRKLLSLEQAAWTRGP